MHIIIGLLGSLVTIMYLLDRLGIDIGGLNPFYWYRRRAFAKKYGADPIYSVEDPMHIASLMVIGVGKLGGDLTAGQKQVAQDLFVKEFSISDQDASQLFGSAAHLLAAPQLIETQLTTLASRNTKTFTPEQAKSLVDMMTKVASADGAATPTQQDYIGEVRSQFVPEPKSAGTW